jgi:hypothetical protein
VGVTAGDVDLCVLFFFLFGRRVFFFFGPSKDSLVDERRPANERTMRGRAGPAACCVPLFFFETGPAAAPPAPISRCQARPGASACRVCEERTPCARLHRTKNVRSLSFQNALPCVSSRRRPPHPRSLNTTTTTTTTTTHSHIELPPDAPPSAARPALRASTPGVPAALYLPRTALVPGRYRAVLSPPADDGDPSSAVVPCVGADATAAIAFVMAPRRASADATAAVGQVRQGGGMRRVRIYKTLPRLSHHSCSPETSLPKNKNNTLFFPVPQGVLPVRRGRGLRGRPARHGGRGSGPVRGAVGRVQQVSACVFFFFQFRRPVTQNTMSRDETITIFCRSEIPGFDPRAKNVLLVPMGCV